MLYLTALIRFFKLLSSRITTTIYGYMMQILTVQMSTLHVYNTEESKIDLEYSTDADMYRRQ